MALLPLADAHRLLEEAAGALAAAAGVGATDDELLSVLTLCEGVNRRIDQVAVSAVAVLGRRGTFAARGYRSPVSALVDLLGWERYEARRRVVAAEQVCPRIGLDGTRLPPRLAATSEGFAAGRVGLQHVEVIAKVLDSAEAARLMIWPTRPPFTPPPSCSSTARRWSRPWTRTAPSPTTRRRHR